MLKTIATSEVAITNLRAVAVAFSSWIASLVMDEAEWIERLEAIGKVAQFLTIIIGMASMAFLAVYNYRKMQSLPKKTISNQSNTQPSTYSAQCTPPRKQRDESEDQQRPSE